MINFITSLKTVVYNNNNYYEYLLTDSDLDAYKISAIDFSSERINDNNFFENYLRYVLVSDRSFAI
jgi:hypothetical protein